MDSKFHVTAFFVQGGNDAPHLGRCQFFILMAQEAGAD